MANTKKARAIERELAERFGSLCLDNRAERMKVARWIAQREEAAALAAHQAVAPPEAPNERGPPDEVSLADADASSSGLHRVPVYEVRLVQSRRPLMLAEPTLADARMSARVLQKLIATTDREHFVCLFVNNRHHITGTHIAAIGAQHWIGTIDVRAVMRAAFAACAHALVIGHNHPSGDPTPSEEDHEFTRNFMRAAEIVAMPVLDHVIVTRDPARYHSMLSCGTLPVADKI